MAYTLTLAGIKCLMLEAGRSYAQDLAFSMSIVDGQVDLLTVTR